MAAERGSSSRAGEKSKIDLEAMLKNMELLDEELDDVVIGKEQAKKFESEARWMAIARVNTDRPFSSSAFSDNMNFIWGLAHTPEFREAGENLFIFKMHCLDDWKKVVHGGPWLFRGFGVIIEDYDGKTDPAAVVLDGLYVWAQIHSVPDMYRHVEIVDQLAARIGRVKEVQLRPNLYFEGDYVRVRARVLTAKPLTRFTPLTVEGEGRRMLIVKYEKITFFCQICGMMGHNHEECGSGVWKEEDKKWGRWMIAQRRTVSYSQPSGGRGAYGGGRSRGQGGTNSRGFGSRGGRGIGVGLSEPAAVPKEKTENAVAATADGTPGEERDASYLHKCTSLENLHVGFSSEVAPVQPPVTEATATKTGVKRGSQENLQPHLTSDGKQLSGPDVADGSVVVYKTPPGIPPLSSYPHSLNREKWYKETARLINRKPG